MTTVSKMKVKKTVSKTTKKGKPRKPRGYFSELVSCYYCPPEVKHERRKLKNRKRVPVCVTHAEEYDANNRDNWPNCPNCGEEEWNPVWNWNGDETKTVVQCRECGKAFSALELFTSYQVWLHASPLEHK
jgi:uncharacterized Zn finger protein